MAGGPFERARELGELDARLRSAQGGDGGVVAVEGPAGIGKSRLLAEFRRSARSTATVLGARGSELEGEFAFGVVRQLLEPELIAPERRDLLLSGAAATAGPVFGAPASEDTGASFAILHGLYWLIANLAEERPVVLCVDDVQWCDLPSLRFLEYLARRLEGLPVLVVLGIRDGHLGADPALMGALLHDPGVTLIRPGPLSVESVAAIIAAELGTAPDAEFAAACHEATGGSPLLVTQLAVALRSAGVVPAAGSVDRVREVGPRAISRTVLLRLEGLGRDAIALAQAVAILGDDSDPRAIAHLSGLDDSRIGTLAALLGPVEILQPEGRLAFVHPLVHDAVYQQLSLGERRLQHARAARTLSDLGAPDEQVAAQLLQAPPDGDPGVVAVLRSAAAAALRAGAPESAATYLRRALAEDARDTDRSRLLLDLGSAEALTYGPAAAEHLLGAFESLSEPTARAQAAALLTRVRLFSGADDPGGPAREAAAELPVGSDDRLGLLAVEYMTGFFRSGDPGRLAALAEYRSLRGGGPGARMMSAMAAWHAVCSDGTAQEAAQIARNALEGDLLRSADPSLVWFAAVNALAFGDVPEGADAWESALVDAHRRGSLLTAGAVHLWLGSALLRQGDLAGAEAALEASAREMRLWGYNKAALVAAEGYLAMVAKERGRTAAAAQLIEQMGASDPGWNGSTWWLLARATVLRWLGRPEEAAAAADALGALGEAVPDAGRLWWRGLKAEALIDLGDIDAARELLDDELVVVRAFGAPSHLGRTLRLRGQIEGDAGEGMLREAVDVLERSLDRLELTKSLHALGRFLRLGRRPTEARAPLLRALDMASACGAAPLEEDIRVELEATGGRPRRNAVTGMNSLTPSERRVVDLVAQGRANRDVAQSLYITPKTVEVHLSSAYRKLGVRSRAEQPEVLARALAATP